MVHRAVAAALIPEAVQKSEIRQAAGDDTDRASVG
jgi:hypothetical protein